MAGLRVPREVGRPRTRPVKVLADRVYSSRAIREHRHLDQAGLGAEAEHLAEEVSEGLLVADPEAGDRRVVGAWFAQIALKAKFSRQRRSIPRELRSPTR